MSGYFCPVLQVHHHPHYRCIIITALLAAQVSTLPFSTCGHHFFCVLGALSANWCCTDSQLKHSFWAEKFFMFSTHYISTYTHSWSHALSLSGKWVRCLLKQTPSGPSRLLWMLDCRSCLPTPKKWVEVLPISLGNPKFAYAPGHLWFSA